METAATIRLTDALALLDSGTPVAVRFVTCNRRRKTGGSFGELPAARLGKGRRQAAGLLRQPTAGEESAADRAACAADGVLPVPKDPAHFRNATRNLVDTRTGALVKVHIYLLTHVAGRKVII